MVDPSTLERIDLFRDPDTGRFLARDPDTGKTFALPLDDLQAVRGEVGVLKSNEVDMQGGPVKNVGTLNTDEVDVNKDLVYLINTNGRISYNPADFADVGAAISQAFTDMGDSTATVRIPAGGGDVSSQLNVPASSDTPDQVTNLIGYAFGIEETQSGCILNSTITNGDDVIVVDDAAGNNKADGNALRDFGLVGSGSDGAGIAYRHVQDVGGITNVGVDGAGKEGFIIGPDTSNQSLRSLQAVNAGKQGMLLTSSVNIDIYNYTGEGNNLEALKVNTCGSVTFDTCELDGASGNAGWVFNIINSDGVDILNSSIENGNDFGGLKIDADCRGVTVGEGTLIKNNSAKGVEIDGTRVVIKDCQINQSNTHIDIDSAAHRVRIQNVSFLGSGTKINAAADATDIYADISSFNGALGASPSSGTLSVSFDTAFTEKPALNVVTEAEANWHVSSWSTDANGNYNGATLTFTNAAGNAANPTTHWKAIPRNVGVV